MIIKNGSVIFKDTVEKKDIRVLGGKIEKIADKLSPEQGEEVIDLSLIHISEPTRPY